MPRVNGASFQSGCYLYVDYTVTTQSVAENYSDIAYTFGIHFGAFYFNSTNRIINWDATQGSGSSRYSSAPSLPFPGDAGTNRDFPYYSSWVRIYHDGNGDGAASFYGQINPSSAGGGGTRSVGPTSFALPHISRYSSAPSSPLISNITSTSVDVSFSDGVGGAPIDARQIGYGTDGSYPQHIVGSGNSATITGLVPGTTYYFWAQTHNSAGWTVFSLRTTTATLGVPSATDAPIVIDIDQTSVTVIFPPNTNGPPGVAIIAHEVAWQTTVEGTTATNGRTNSVVATTPKTIGGLNPVTTYYFWVRSQNSVGWGPWSLWVPAKTIAGARVNVSGVWKEAIPYIKVAGVWKIARPWSRVLGVWKESS